MRARTNISLKDRLQLKLSDFKGVDFSSSPLAVHPSRATSMSNFINEYGVNKKRNGWKELFNIPDITQTVEGVTTTTKQKINNIFHYKHGTHDVLIVHAGRKFYEATLNDGNYTTTDITRAGWIHLKDQRSQTFFNKGRAYIIGCGDYLVYGTWDNGASYELRRVMDDDDTYIPTTTISIDDDAVEDDIRASLDDVNYLSTKRKNKMLGISQYFPTRDIRYQAGRTYYIKNGDTYTQYTPTVGDEIVGGIYESRGETYGYFRTLDDNYKVGKNYYTKSGNVFNSHAHTDGDDIVSVVYERGGVWTVDTADITSGTEVVIEIETFSVLTSSTNIERFYNILNGTAYGDILYHNVLGMPAVAGTIYWDKGKIAINVDTTPPIEGRDNITVTFEHTVEGYADRITQCNFGTLFGVNGNTDRLFLSGNEDYPNIDFHSEADDYTYFGDLSTASMGSDSVAINGYARLSDSTLVIYKEEKGHESSIFYRTGSYKETYDNAGNLESIRGVFPVTAGSIGECVVSRFACANFGGDTIMLSRNGVYGIVLAENVATNERYAKERSRSINEKLKTHNLREAVGTVHDNKYYLSVDGVCYVADSRFKYTSETDNSYNYEWWYWDNIPARVWASIDNQLYFGTEDGRVCVFDNEYTDRKCHTSADAELTISVDRSKITYNANMDIDFSENDQIRFATGGIYAFLLNATVKNDTSNLGETADELMEQLFEEMVVYADECSSLEVDTPYKICNIDRNENTFQIKNEEGTIMAISGSFRLHELISNRDMYITNVTSGNFQLKRNATTDNVITISNYNDVTPSLSGATFTHKDNVVARWYTPVFDFGTNEYSKTLLKMIISTSARTNGQISVGYETVGVNKLINAQGVSVFSFDNLAFDNFTFNTGFASSYTVRTKERNFNYIVFRFISDNEYDCAVNNFSVVYKINKTNRGVR